MADLPLTYLSKAQLVSSNTERSSTVRMEPTTCVDAEPYALQVLDESMAPEFWSGCIILIDPTGRATKGSYVLARRNETNHADPAMHENNELQAEYLFRQLQRDEHDQWVLVALNSAFETIKTDQHLSNVVGVIVQRAGKRRHQHKRYD